MQIHQQDTAIEAYREGHRTMQRRVLAYLRDCGSRGATILEIATALGVPSNCVTGRLHDMAEKATERPLVAILPAKRHCDVNGRQKIVWVAIVREIQVPLFRGAA